MRAFVLIAALTASAGYAEAYSTKDAKFLTDDPAVVPFVLCLEKAVSAGKSLNGARSACGKLERQAVRQSRQADVRLDIEDIMMTVQECGFSVEEGSEAC